MKPIRYPYVPDGRCYRYVGAQNPHMAFARDFARNYSLDEVMPTASVVVSNGVILGAGANGSDFHKKYKCRRIILGCKSGEGYEFCEGCHPKNHSERRAIQAAKNKGCDTTGANLYLWGHWWCCQSCWDAILKAGISKVFLLEYSEALFNKEHPDNIVGRQFII